MNIWILFGGIAGFGLSARVLFHLEMRVRSARAVAASRGMSRGDEASRGEPENVVTLSGGGLRAAAFSLGAMLYVLEQQATFRVDTVASVSGSSIVNGFLARMSRLPTPAELDSRLRPLTSNIAHWGPMPASPKRHLAYLLTIGAFSFSIIVVVLGRGLANKFDWPVPVVVGVLTVYAVAQLIRSSVSEVLSAPKAWLRYMLERGAIPSHAILKRNQLRTRWAGWLSWLPMPLWLMERTVARAAFYDLPATKLSDVSTWYRPVFCSTELTTGDAFLASPEGVFCAGLDRASRMGAHDSLTLDSAIHGSAAFPGAFTPVKVKVEGSKPLFLVDGGVSDNLGPAFQSSFGQLESSQVQDFGGAEFWLVIDGGSYRRAAFGSNVASRALLGTSTASLSSRLLCSARAGSLVHEANSHARRLALRAAFTQSGSGANGVLIVGGECQRRMLESEIQANQLAEHANQHLVELADQNDILDYEQSAQRVAVFNAAPTTLVALGADQTATIVQHGYVSTALALSVKRGMPFPKPESYALGRFERLAEEQIRPEPSMLELARSGVEAHLFAAFLVIVVGLGLFSGVRDFILLSAAFFAVRGLRQELSAVRTAKKVNDEQTEASA